ncbi:DUF721 domain-containing protein [Candidatus Parcubacteria bacterium]|nr:DUF721 domain-containing protein [Patescibacteria group bacterium]MBU4482081.1 DUF721 domain-containing protein [Patescibacteria group bacterium]MCG2686562.1 DUF721 domain-containing protein [Candidatus Parcubacteria bacterium]
MPFSTIGKILNKNLQKRSGLAKQIHATLICEEFDKIIAKKWGQKIINKVKAMYFKDNTLTIASLSSVAAQEIKLHEQKILEKINLKFENAVKQIRYLI